MCAGARLVVTVVACRRQPEKVHALGRPDAIARLLIEFLLEPLHMCTFEMEMGLGRLGDPHDSRVKSEG